MACPSAPPELAAASAALLSCATLAASRVWRGGEGRVGRVRADGIQQGSLCEALGVGYEVLGWQVV